MGLEILDTSYDITGHTESELMISLSNFFSCKITFLLIYTGTVKIGGLPKK